MYLKGGRTVALYDAAKDNFPSYFLAAKPGIHTFTADCPRMTGSYAAFRSFNLKKFYGKLPALIDGNNLFNDSSFDAKSIKIILTSIPKYTSGTRSIGVGFRKNWSNDQEIAKMLDTTTPIAAGTYRCYEINEDGSVGDDKGWTVTVK